MMKKMIAVLLAAVMTLAVTACGGGTAAGTAGEDAGSGESGTAEIAEEDAGLIPKDPRIRVGSKDFTESLIVAEIYALALEDAGYPVNRFLNISSSIVHDAIVAGEIDLYPEYTGTGLCSVLQMEADSDPEKVYSTVKAAYDEQFGITWLDPTKINDRNGIAIRTPAAEKYNIYNMSQLQQNADRLRLCSQGEFEVREDGLPGLEKVYGKFNFESIEVYDNSIKYQILEYEEADACPGYSTDAQLVFKDKFTYLEDDKGFWPPYYLTPIVRNEVLEEEPGIADALNAVSAKLDTETIIELNARVDIDHEPYDVVAGEFYETVCGEQPSEQ